MSDDVQTNEGGTGARGNGVSVSTTLSVIVAAIAVLLGFLILKDLNRDTGGTSIPSDTEVPVDTTPTGETTVPAVTTTLARTGFKVLVANASGVTGSAGQMTTALRAEGFIVSEPTNAAETVGKMDTTMVYYVPGYESGAAAVAQILGGVATQPVATPAPVETGELGEATVLVLLGTDLAGKLLPGALPTATPTGDTATTTTTTIA